MGTLLVCAAYNTQKCCLFTTWPLLSYLPKSEEVFRLGLSDIQLLRCSYRVSVITQKARLCLQDLLPSFRFGSASVSALWRLVLLCAASFCSVPPHFRSVLCALRLSTLRSSLCALRSPLSAL